MAEWIGAVDGGGSKTASVLLSQEGDLVWLPPFAGCNPQDNTAWQLELDRAIDALLSKVPKPAAVTMGMPGYGEIPKLDQAVSAAVSEKLGSKALIQNDVEMAFHGAFPQGTGILLLAGTGSMAIVGYSGDLTRIGGWGDQFGDEGSAYWIGRQALSYASRELDGRLPQSGFADDLCKVIGLSNASTPLALMGWVTEQKHARSAIAGLARSIDEMAENGQARAQAILEAAADLLAEHVEAAAASGRLPKDMPWTTAGSVFGSAYLRQAVTRKVGRAPIAPSLPPIGGGLLLAARQASWATDNTFIETLARLLAPASI